MKRSLRWIIFFLVITSLLLAACAPAAPKASPKVTPAVVEKIEGTEFNRVTLTEKAAGRLGVKTEAVREEVVVRKRTVGGTIVDASSIPATGSSASVSGSSDKFVSVSFTDSDRGLLDKSQPVHIKFLGDDAADSGDDDMLTEPLGMEDADEPGDVDAPVYLKFKGDSAKLTTGQSVLVEYTLKGSSAPQKIVPYSAIVYDLKGNTWVYTSPSALVFVREAVKVDYINGDMAILLEGPAAGAQVATVGVPELYGIDTGVNK